MPHNLTTMTNADGSTFTAFLYNEKTVGVPWHGLGISHDGRFPIVWGAAQIGADFRVRQRPVFLDDGNQVEGWKAIVHPDSAHVFQVVTDSYEPVDFVDLAEALALAMDEENMGPQGNTIGLLEDDASRFFVTAESQMAQVGAAQVKRFIVFESGHKNRAVRIFGTDINVVCQNTLNAGLRIAEKQKDNFVSLPHKKGVNDRVKAIAQGIQIAQEIQARTLENYMLLAETRVDQESVTQFVEDLFPWNKEENGPAPDRVVEKRIKVEQAYRYPRVDGKPTGSIGESAFDLLNAASWWTDHYQAKDSWARTTFSPACVETRQKAYNLVMAMA